MPSLPRLSYASTKNKDMLYAVKIPVADEFFMLEVGDTKYIFLSSLELEFFKEKNSNNNIEVKPINTSFKKQTERALDIISTYGKSTAIEVPTYFPLDIADFLREKGITLHVVHDFYPERAIKKQFEIDSIEESITKTHAAFQKIEEILKTKKEVTVEYLKQEVDRVLFEQGMLNIEGMIISCGKDTAIPHHPGSGKIFDNVPIICDIFPLSRESDYFADMTRTYVRGTPDKKFQDMYEAVNEAQKAAFKKIKPGVSVQEVHKACCDIFIERGFDVGEKGFTHATGHGLGLDLHEAPTVSPRGDALLEVGHVITVEPGLYYPDVGGVRLEDVVVVTKDGYRNLTNYPNKFILE